MAFLADRMSILMAVCIIQNGGHLNPWFRDDFYDQEAGAEIREMQEYHIAKQIIRNMLKREVARSTEGTTKVGKPVESNQPTEPGKSNETVC